MTSLFEGEVLGASLLILISDIYIYIYIYTVKSLKRQEEKVAKRGQEEDDENRRVAQHLSHTPT